MHHKVIQHGAQFSINFSQNISAVVHDQNTCVKGSSGLLWSVATPTTALATPTVELQYKFKSKCMKEQLQTWCRLTTDYLSLSHCVRSWTPLARDSSNKFASQLAMADSDTLWANLKELMTFVHVAIVTYTTLCVRSCSVTVSTWDSESQDPSSNLSRTYFFPIVIIPQPLSQIFPCTIEYYTQICSFFFSPTKSKKFWSILKSNDDVSGHCFYNTYQ